MGLDLAGNAGFFDYPRPSYLEEVVANLDIDLCWKLARTDSGMNSDADRP
jgi:hypothetical protein